MKKNRIEINLETIENITSKNFIQSEIAHCNKNKIRVELLVNPYAECSGQFSDEPDSCLTVFIKGSIDEWLPIFVHETCHKDQFLEKADVWAAKIGNEYDAMDDTPYDPQYLYYECYMDDVDHFCCEKICENTGKKWSFSTVLPINKNYPSCIHRWILYYYFKYV